MKGVSGSHTLGKGRGGDPNIGASGNCLMESLKKGLIHTLGKGRGGEDGITSGICLM